MGKFASGLLNYVDSVNYNGYKKTVFYSEFATNFVVGDKVFIINGNYDSDNFISSSNYSAGIDGYTILDIDRCRVTLDIDYTGNLPSSINNIDEYIKVYHISSQREFDYINNTTINSYDNVSNNTYNKFEYKLSNNIAFVDSTFSGSTNSIFGEYGGIANSGFYQRLSNSSGVSLWFELGNFLGTSSIPFATTGSPTYSLTNNGKLLIIGEDIIFNNTTLKSRGVYAYSETLNKWNFDIPSNKPYISKLNFRNGLFKGTWNDGIFGTYIDQINWYGNSAKWNSGIFINSNWKNGVLNSKTNNNNTNSGNANTALLNAQFYENTPVSVVNSTINSGTPSRGINFNSPTNLSDTEFLQNYYCYINSNGVPIQTTDYSNNKGFGFNYIIDSNIEQASIINGNFNNCNIGLTNYGISSLDVYYGLSYSYSIASKSGYYKFCDFNTALLSNSSILDSNIINSKVQTSRLSSNQIKNSVASGTYNSENGVNILKADLWSYTIDGVSLRGILKLFISEIDLLRMQNFEVIHIDKIKKDLYLTSFNDENKVYLNIENEYILDYFNNPELSTDPIIVSRKNKNENLYKTSINFDGSIYSTTHTANTTELPSIDIDLGSTLAWYQSGSTITSNNSIITPYSVNNLFTDTMLSIADFESGLLLNSTWESGSSFNSISSKIQLDGDNLGISMPFGSTNSLIIRLTTDVYNQYDTFDVDDYIWLNGIDYTDIYSNVTKFSGTFKVEYITPVSTWRQLYLTEVTNNILGLTPGGVFSINGFLPNYISVNRFKIENSTIESGLFKTILINNSTIYNSTFDNTDQNLTVSNIDKLRFINTLFKDDFNAINSGVIYKSHILNTTWNNAISFNNIFSGQTFSNGVFNNGYWLNSTFNNGYFVNSDDTSITLTSYDDYSVGYYRSWRDGIFNSGQFYNSVWIDGVFNNGRLYNSKWYGGIWNNGILGLKNSPYLITTMGYYPNLSVGATQTYWYNGTVESAIIGGASTIHWYNGVFNDGEFTSFGDDAQSTWYNGTFNGGRFDGFAKWKNGIFNNGKFLSYYGYTSSNVSHYSTSILNPGYGFNIGDTFSIIGGDNTATGTINSVSNASGLTLQINAVGNTAGSGFILRVLTVSAAPTFSILTYNIYSGGTGYTSSELAYIDNFSNTSQTRGRISVSTGGTVTGFTILSNGFGFSASGTYSSILYSGNSGPIIDASIVSPGLGYIVGDSFTISNGTTPASGQVLSVGYIGNVTSFTLSSYGTGYTPSTTTHSTSLYNNSIGHIVSYTIDEKGNNYAIGNYNTIPNTTSTGTGFTISIVSLDTDIRVENCSWEYGKFNGGQFGEPVFVTNSTWYDGEFNGGIFNGKFWYSGVFTNGKFNGSSTTASFKNEINFVNSFTNNYYGIWLDGYVVTQAHIGNPNQRVYTELLRATDTKKITNNVVFQNMLWLGGTFSHSSGIIYNSAWLNGSFISGEFNSSSFNPFIDQSLSGGTNSNTLSFNFNNSCVWINGVFNNSAFYISEWKDGKFNSGYMLGGIWRKGTWNYGTAENIYWESGLWRNGNWYGSNFGTSTIDSTQLQIIDPMAQSVLYNIASASNNNSIHLMNAFTGSSPEVLYDPTFTYAAGGDNRGWAVLGTWTYSSTYTVTTYYPAHSYSGGLYTFAHVNVTTIPANNYKLNQPNNYTSYPLTGMIQSGGVFSNNVFTDYANYTVKVIVHIDYPLTLSITSMPNNVQIGVQMGYTVSYTNCAVGTSTITKSYTKDDIYYWTSGFTNTKLQILKSSSGNSLAEQVSILSVTVNESLISYNPLYNNKLYNVYGASASPSITATLSLPALTLTSDIGVGLQYGNGMFYSGVWENGIWENGYRNDDTLTYCDLYPVASYIKISKYTHRLQLKFIDTTITTIFNIGDYVSVGNVIGIDVNGIRKLLKDKFKVVYVDNSSIVLEYTLTSPILEITKDSQNHLIYLSKNVWLSGGFLCGYFSGIWNYGLFKGYPYIAEMSNSHLIDGIFDGGHFMSSIGTYSITGGIATYNTGLVQNFSFKDNNVGQANSSLYLSWIDVNYSTQSQVNLNKKSTIFSTFISGGGGEYPYTYNYQNIYGSPTYDILSSNSYFKIGNNNINYMLGNKSTIYNNLIPDSGNFENPVSSTNAYVGLDNLLNNSWTYSNTYGTTDVESNMTDPTSELLNLQGGELIISNTNVKLNTESDRYYQVDMTFTEPHQATNIRILNTSYNESVGWAASPGSFNHALTSVLTKTEYFYNKKSFDLYMYSSLSASITNMSFYEVDMIPFLQYATESNIDQTIYYPYVAIAPYIDYTNANYNYVGNIVLTIDVDTIGSSSSVYTPANSGNMFTNPASNTAATITRTF